MAFDKLQEEKGMALADFLRDFHEAPFELIHGKRIPIMPSLAGHTILIRAIVRLLEAYVLPLSLGEILTEATVVQEHRKDWVKGSFTPDILFFGAERFEQYMADHADWQERPFALVPDIVIEVVSKNDSYSDINEKVMAYLELGVKEIWVIDPHAKNAFLHSAKKTLMLHKNDSLQSSVLANFSLKLAELYEKK